MRGYKGLVKYVFTKQNIHSKELGLSKYNLFVICSIFLKFILII